MSTSNISASSRRAPQTSMVGTPIYEHGINLPQFIRRIWSNVKFNFSTMVASVKRYFVKAKDCIKGKIQKVKQNMARRKEERILRREIRRQKWKNSRTYKFCCKVQNFFKNVWTSVKKPFQRGGFVYKFGAGVKKLALNVKTFFVQTIPAKITAIKRKRNLARLERMPGELRPFLCLDLEREGRIPALNTQAQEHELLRLAQADQALATTPGLAR